MNETKYIAQVFLASYRKMRDAGIIMFIESTRFKKRGPPLGRIVFGEPQFVHFFAEISVRIFN